jgi:hypothetical protein
MAEVPKVHRVSREDLEIGELVEKKEHPWASASVARKIATDHLRRNPNAYSGGGGGSTTEISLNQNIKVRPMRKKKPPVPKPQPPAWQTWGQELL